MSDECNLVVARLLAHVVDHGRQVVNCELADVVIPEARVAAAEALVPHVEDAAVVAEEHLVAAVTGEPKGEAALLGGDKGSRGLEEAVHDEDRVSAAAVAVLLVGTLGADDPVHAEVVAVFRLDGLVANLKATLLGVVSDVLDETLL